MPCWPSAKVGLSFQASASIVTFLGQRPPVEIIKKVTSHMTQPSWALHTNVVRTAIWCGQPAASHFQCLRGEHGEGNKVSAQTVQLAAGKSRPASSVEWSYAMELILSSLISALSSIFLIKINELYYWLCLLSCVFHQALQSSLTFLPPSNLQLWGPCEGRDKK